MSTRKQRTQWLQQEAPSPRNSTLSLSEADKALFGSIMDADSGAIIIGGFKLTALGLAVEGSPRVEDWEKLGGHLRLLQRSMMWIVGDWMAYGEREWGKTYEQAKSISGRSIGTLYNWARVCSAVDFSRRRETLMFSHHVEVAALDPEQQAYWLERAESERLSVKRLRVAIAGGDGEDQYGEETPLLLDNNGAKAIKRALKWGSVAVDTPRQREQVLREIAAARKALDAVEKRVRGS